MLTIIYVFYVILAVIDLVLGVIFMKLGYDGDSREERAVYISCAVVYIVMTLYFALVGIHGIIY